MIINAKHIGNLGIVLFFISGTLYVTDIFKSYQQLILIASIFFLLVPNIGKIIKIRKSVGLLCLIFIFLILSIIMSCVVRLEIFELVSGIGLFLVGFATYSLIPTNLNAQKKDVIDIFWWLLIIHLLLFAYSFLVYPIKFSSYEGIFTNPNATGGVAVTLFAIAAPIFLDCFESGRSDKRYVISGISVVLSILVALITTSRTSIITSLILMMITFFLILRMDILNKKTNRLLKLSILVCGITLLLYATGILDELLGNVLYKFELKEDNTLSGRDVYWQEIFDTMKFWGNGEGTGIAAHNTYLSMLDQYGVFACVSICIFVIVGIIKSLGLSLSNGGCTWKFIPLYSFVAFGVLGMAEGMMLKTVMLMSVFSASILSKNFKSQL